MKSFNITLSITLVFTCFQLTSFTQTSGASDSVIRLILGESSVPARNDKGAEMLYS